MPDGIDPNYSDLQPAGFPTPGDGVRNVPTNERLFMYIGIGGLILLILILILIF